jgi:hypothetical protein
LFTTADPATPAFIERFANIRSTCLEGRQESKYQYREQSQGKRKNQHAGIHCDWIAARQSGGQQRRKKIDSPDGQNYSEGAPDQPKGQAFDYNLPHNAKTAGAQTRTNRQFSSAGRGARQ